MKTNNTTHIGKAINSHLYEHVFTIQTPVNEGECIGYRLCFTVITTDPDYGMTANTLHAAIDQIYDHISKDYHQPISGGLKFSSKECPASDIWGNPIYNRLSVSYLYPLNDSTWIGEHDLKNCVDGERGDARQGEESVYKIF